MYNAKTTNLEQQNINKCKTGPLLRLLNAQVISEQSKKA